MKKKPTIIDIAKKSGFSKSTVSNVLRDAANVKKTTKDKILKVVREVGYQPDEIARSMVMKKRMNYIGLIIADISNPFYAEVVLGADTEAQLRNCNLVLCSTNFILEKERNYIDILIRNRALGLLIATSTIMDENISYLVNQRYPFVLISRKVSGLDTNRVAIDYHKAAKEVVNYLINKGHVKIAHFTGPKIIHGIMQRMNGYKKALQDNGIKVDNDLIFSGQISIKSGYELAEKLLKSNKKATAIFTADDNLAIGAKEFFEEKGYVIPKDISIVGFDNISIAKLKSINLTTVEQPKFEMGKKAVEILFNQIKDPVHFKPHEYMFKTKIIERGTVSDIRK